MDTLYVVRVALQNRSISTTVHASVRTNNAPSASRRTPLTHSSPETRWRTSDKWLWSNGLVPIGPCVDQRTPEIPAVPQV